MKKLQEIFDVDLLTKVLKILGVILAIFIIFSAGVVTGVHKSNFGKNWGEHYKDNFGMGYKKGNTGGFRDKLPMMGYFPNAHGAIGKIIKIELPNIIVADTDNLEKIIIINETTKIQEARTEINNIDLKIDDFVVIIGSPNEKGQIEAKIIRKMPSPEFME